MSPSSVAPTIVNPFANADVNELVDPPPGVEDSIAKAIEENANKIKLEEKRDMLDIFVPKNDIYIIPCISSYSFSLILRGGRLFLRLFVSDSALDF